MNQKAAAEAGPRHADQTAEAHRGRHPGFPSFNVLSGGLGSLALALSRPQAADSAGKDRKQGVDEFERERQNQGACAPLNVARARE